MPLSPSAPSGTPLSLRDPLFLCLLFQEHPPFVTSHFCSSLKCPSLTTSRLAPLSSHGSVKSLVASVLDITEPTSSRLLLGQQTQCFQGLERSEAVDEDNREW